MKRKKLYRKAAQAMTEAGIREEESRRYLSLLRREKVLKNGLKEMKRSLLDVNPLGAIEFTPPLSVAGEPSIVVVRAEGLLLKGIPVALEPDEQGRHRGTPLAEVQERIQQKLGQVLSAEEVLGWYAQLVALEQGMPVEHPSRRFSCIPRLLNRLQVTRLHLEKEIGIELEKLVRRRFYVFMPQEALADALAHTPPSQQVMLVRGQDGALTLNQVRVNDASGEGFGNVVVRQRDLVRLLEACQRREGCRVITLDFHRSHWVGWLVCAAGTDAKDCGPMLFGYAGQKKPRL